MRRSACSVLVGMPVEGPPRCTLTMTSGSSAMTARPIISDLSARPGPEVVVHAMAPPKAAPMAEPMPAISSSAWNVTTFISLKYERVLQDLGGGRDGIAADEDLAAGELGGDGEAERSGAVAGDVPVGPGLSFAAGTM